MRKKKDLIEESAKIFDPKTVLNSQTPEKSTSVKRRRRRRKTAMISKTEKKKLSMMLKHSNFIRAKLAKLSKKLEKVCSAISKI